MGDSCVVLTAAPILAGFTSTETRSSVEKPGNLDRAAGIISCAKQEEKRKMMKERQRGKQRYIVGTGYSAEGIGKKVEKT